MYVGICQLFGWENQSSSTSWPSGRYPEYCPAATVSQCPLCSVNVALKQYVLVEERYNFIAKAKELIYKTLCENDIEIPFPQRDIHIKSTVQ